MAPNIQGAADTFSLGKSAMTWVPAMLQLGLIQKYAPDDLDYGVGPMPAGPGGHQLIAQSGGPLLEIPAQARNPEGAWELIKILQSKEGQLAYVDDHWDTRATFPGRMSVAQSEEFRSRPGVGELVDLLDHVFPVGHAAHVFSTDDYYISGVVPAVDAFIYDKETPKAALDKATACGPGEDGLPVCQTGRARPARANGVSPGRISFNERCRPLAACKGPAPLPSAEPGQRRGRRHCSARSCER